jgi:hypothetical protein
MNVAIRRLITHGMTRTRKAACRGTRLGAPTDAVYRRKKVTRAMMAGPKKVATMTIVVITPYKKHGPASIS